jgi:hypothetical protein
VALPFARTARQPGHLGGRPGLVVKSGPFRVLLHPRLAMVAPHPSRPCHISAIGFARQQRFLDGKSLLDQQP